MKKTTTKFILGISAVIAFNTANAQFPVITSANQLHTAGDSIHYIDLTSFGFDPIPAGGSNVVWDFSSITSAGTTVDFVYKIPATQPSAASYPTANASLVISTVAGNEWFKESPDSIIRLGLSSPDPALGDLIYDNGAFIRFKFPFTAGDSWSTTSYSGTQSGDFGVPGTVLTVANGSFSATVDAFGTMTLPNGSVVNDVVRIHVIEQFDFLGDIGVGVPLNLGTLSDDYYYWFAESFQDPIMISGTTLTNGGSPATVLRYQPIISTSVTDKVSFASKISIYPNPGNGIFNIDIANADNNNVVSVLNVLGQTVHTESIQSSNNQIDVSFLDKGVYFIKISNNETNLTKRVIIK